MRLPHCLLIAVCVWLVAVPVRAERAQDRTRPIVRLVATGGTISNRTGARLTADELITSVPSVNRYADVEAEQFANLPSSSLTVDQWLGLARRINELFGKRPELTGIVVTSGTDTLEETAYFLHLTVKSDRPVVVVGAMRAPDEPGYEGTANLLQGFRVAAFPASRGRGVLVVLNNEIHAARDVTKTNAQRLDTFDSGPYGVIGVVDADHVVFYRRPSRRHTRRTEFDVDRIDRLPRVDILLTYLGAQGDLIASARERGAEGLVIAAAGAGSTTPSQLDAIRRLVDDGTIVVITTRTGRGRVPPRRLPLEPTPNDDGTDWRYSPNRVSGEDLSPVKARVLLMLALTKTTDGTEIQRMFTVY